MPQRPNPLAERPPFAPVPLTMPNGGVASGSTASSPVVALAAYDERNSLHSRREDGAAGSI